MQKLCCPHRTHTYAIPSIEGSSQSSTLVLQELWPCPQVLRLHDRGEVSLSLQKKYLISVRLVMSFPFNNLSFPLLHVPKWKSRGKKIYCPEREEQERVCQGLKGRRGCHTLCHRALAQRLDGGSEWWCRMLLLLGPREHTSCTQPLVSCLNSV